MTIILYPVSLQRSRIYFGGQMHTHHLRVRIFVQYPIGSASKACVLVLPPTTKQLKNLVISNQVPSVNSSTSDGLYNFHELIHGSEEYFIGSFMDDGSLLEERSIPSKIENNHLYNGSIHLPARGYPAP